MREGPRDTGSPGAGDSEWRAFALEMGGVFCAVALVAVFLFAISGLWPPLVAIESGSMEPQIQTNDLVFVMEEHRFPGPGSHGETGVVTASAGERTGYESFDRPGDVIVYRPDGLDRRTPVIHRAMFWVEDGENWYDRADPAHLGGAENCAQLANCPADHAGFVTKGDYNDRYDQVGRPGRPISEPVKPSWVVGTAEARVPWLGNVRLRLAPLLRGLVG
jgi:signal peptidase